MSAFQSFRAAFSRRTALDPTHRADPDGYAIARWLFLRLLGLSYLFAFWSVAQQIRGLVGHDGILPAREFMASLAQAAAAQHVGFDRFRLVPTLCWLNASDAFLQSLSIGGAGLAALLVAGVAPALVLPMLWLAYLSLAVVSREFLSYQWDALLLETGLLAMAIAPLRWRESLRDASDPPRLGRWLIWWLLFRLMFGSGLVKLASGDPTWRGLTALAAHYETQPLPTPVAWYAAQLPLGFHRASTLLVLVVELAVPWLVLGPRRMRRAASVVLAGLQASIALTGNYAFFNLLTVALCALLLDDEAFARIGLVRRPVPRDAARGPGWLAAVVACVTVPVSAATLTGQFGVEVPAAGLVAPLARFIDPLRSVNPYGLFAVMTTTRPEIVLEGSSDGLAWIPYEFRYKPGDPARRPPWIAPFQPRLDWQMWFAALGRYENERWFHSFCLRLLEGSPAVKALLASDPFPDAPPRFVRGVLYQYRFADRATRRTSGAWWTRQRLGLYSGPLSLDPSADATSPMQAEPDNQRRAR